MTADRNSIMSQPAPPAGPDRSLPADDAARALARRLLAEARHGALAFADPESGAPGISRVALGLDAAGVPVSLMSSLTQHEPALRARPDAALMVGEVGAKGDPLTHPRLMLTVRAAFVAADDPDRPALRDLWLRDHPKSTLYVDFADFHFVRLVPVSALLNGGFGRAHRLDAADLGA